MVLNYEIKYVIIITHLALLITLFFEIILLTSLFYLVPIF